MYDYLKLKESLETIVALSEDLLMPNEIKGVRDFIDVGEYGLAFETLLDILAEKGKKISSDVRSKLIEVGQMMEIEYSEIEARLTHMCVEN